LEICEHDAASVVSEVYLNLLLLGCVHKYTDDVVPASNKEVNQSNRDRETLVKTSLENKESDVVKDVFHGSQSTIKEHVEEPLWSESITKKLSIDTDALVNACSLKPSAQAPAAGGKFHFLAYIKWY
jgi:hypothetical protein